MHATPWRERARRRAALGVHAYARAGKREREVLIRAYTRTRRMDRRININAPAWAAIVRTHKVETREKPTVNRRFRS